MLDTIKQYKFMIFVFSVLLVNIAIGANSSYISVLVKETGASVAILGFVWFVIAISEIPAFFFGSHLQKRYGELNIYLWVLVLETLLVIWAAEYCLKATEYTSCIELCLHSAFYRYW